MKSLIESEIKVASTDDLCTRHMELEDALSHMTMSQRGWEAAMTESANIRDELKRRDPDRYRALREEETAKKQS